MRRRTFALLFATLALTGCGGARSPTSGDWRPEPITAMPQPGPGGGPAGQRGGRQVAILLPLSGPRAEVGQSMLRAAQLALDAPGAPALLAKDTGGTPQGAAAAAAAALGAGAGLLLGPLTAAETEAVAPLARNADVAVLAFTNDPAQAQPGVWTLGITPAQQVRRLVAAAQTQGKSQFAALLPDSDFGRAMATALMQTTEARGLPTPIIQHYTPGMGAITAAVRGISGYANRRGPIDAKVRAARAKSTPEGRKEAAELVKTPIPPPPFDALLLADTGDSLEEIASLLPYYDLDRSMVRVLGPALWADPASRSGRLPGAWYAAPDPATRAVFVQGYTARYAAAPSPIADLAVDAAAIARVLAGVGYSAGALTQPQGFAGVDGPLALQPDGRVRRGLAVFEVQRGGAQMVEPAPETLAAPGT